MSVRVLVTGGAGFLGSHLVDSLIARGDEVVVLDDLSRGHREQVDDAVEFIEGDCCNPEVWEKICSNPPEIIHHLAAINGTRLFHEIADRVVEVNINGTINAISAARKIGARLVFYSSPEAYGEQGEMPLSNNSNSLFTPAKLHQRHSYGASKYLGEILIQHAVRNGIDARIVRPYNVYGSRLHGDKNGQVVAMMIQDAKDRGIVEVHGSGKQTRSLTWIDDVIVGMLLVGDLDDLSGQAFNLGSTEEISMNYLAGIICEKLNATKKNTSSNHGDSNRRLPDVSGNLAIGWKATTSLESGLNQLIDDA